MKKNLNYKLLVTSVCVILALLFLLVLTVNSANPTITYAYSENEEVYYASLGNSRKETESFTYTTKTVDSYLINPSFPNYYNNNGNLQNTCANVAGANIIGYYDRYYDNLIPDTATGYERNNKYTYYPMKYSINKFQNVINDLYVKMSTNIYDVGSTQTQYKNGLSAYVNSKGLSVSYSSVLTNKHLDLDKVIVQLKKGNPISLFMSGYNFTKLSDNGSVVIWDKYLYDDNHIAVAYGYDKVSYFNSNGSLIRTEVYLKVSTGIYGVDGVYIVNKYGNLNDAESAKIF